MVDYAGHLPCQWHERLSARRSDPRWLAIEMLDVGCAATGDVRQDDDELAISACLERADENLRSRSEKGSVDLAKIALKFP